jgi:alpha-tubulin suppressor-like RCC1 family protein
MLNQFTAPVSLYLDVPARSRRVLKGESIDFFVAALPAEQASRLDLYRDGELWRGFSSNSISGQIDLPASGLVTLRVDAFGTNGQMIASASQKVLVVDELNIPIHPRILPQQNSSSPSFVLDADNEIYAFGPNHYGELGIGRFSQAEFLPVQVTRPQSVHGWMNMAAGSRFAFGISDDGLLYSWGDNPLGQLGSMDITNSSVPLLITNLAQHAFVKVVAGGSHALALSSTGELWAWGNNQFGQLGTGTTNAFTVPQRIAPPSQELAWTNIYAGFNSSYAVASDGVLYSWGNNRFGQLGVNLTNTVFPNPVPMAFPEGVLITNLSAGDDHGLALSDAGNLYAWGRNSGTLGLGDSETNLPEVVFSPIEIPDQRGWKSISASGLNLALDNQSQLYSWGPHFSAYFSVSNAPTLLVVSNISSWEDISAGVAHALAIGSDGLVYSWGAGFNGDLGSGRMDFRYTPEIICSLDNICPDITNLPPVLNVSWPGLGDTFPPSGVLTINAQADDPDGFISKMELYAITGFPSTTNLIASLDEPSYTFQLSSDDAGSYLFRAYDNSGAVDESGSHLIAFPSIRTPVGGQTNSFTGFREWSVSIYPGTLFSLEGAGIMITNLPPGVRLANATGSTNGFPLLRYNYPVRTYSSISFTIELDGDLPDGFIPAVAVVDFSSVPIQPSNGSFEPLIHPEKLANGFGFEIPGSSSADGYIEYSSDLTNWFPSPVPATPGPNGTRWFDNGPPKTSAPPGPHRYYRARHAN